MNRYELLAVVGSAALFAQMATLIWQHPAALFNAQVVAPEASSPSLPAAAVWPLAVLNAIFAIGLVAFVWTRMGLEDALPFLTFGVALGAAFLVPELTPRPVWSPRYGIWATFIYCYPASVIANVLYWVL